MTPETIYSIVGEHANNDFGVYYALFNFILIAIVGGFFCISDRIIGVILTTICIIICIFGNNWIHNAAIVDQQNKCKHIYELIVQNQLLITKSEAGKGKIVYKLSGPAESSTEVNGFRIYNPPETIVDLELEDIIALSKLKASMY